MSEDSAFWRRLDVPGHDTCRVTTAATGRQLQGKAVFLQNAVPAALDYSVTCDPDWVSASAEVRGWIGKTEVDFAIHSSGAGRWMLDGQRVPAVDGCIDLDLGFTPATNVLPLRRLGLSVGQTAEVTSAWLDITAGTLEPLAQTYERRAEDSYWYEAPRFGYAGSLEVTPAGFVRIYPGLWEMEPDTLG